METLRIHRGSPFRMARHLHRLEESRRILGLPRTIPADAIRDGAHSLVQAARLGEGLLRITMTAPDPRRSSQGTLLMTVRALPAIPPSVTLHICENVRRVPGPLSACKTTSRALEAAALREARGVGAFDALLLNPAGRIVETTARNVFFVRTDTVSTPPLSEAALPGITREAVLGLLPEVGFELKEIPIPREELAQADEVFVTGSGVGVLGIGAVGDHAFGATPGPRTRRISDAYERLLGRDCRW